MKLIDYLPHYYGGISEIVQLLMSEDVDFDHAAVALSEFPLENTILNGSAKAVALWEEFLGIDALGDLPQRKMYLIAVLRGQGTLNEEKINDIVNSFSGAVNSASVDLLGSIIRVRVLPPTWGEIYLFDEIKKTLLPRVPAHLKLSVERYYRTWQDVLDTAVSWSGVYANYDSWDEVKLRI